MFIRFAPAVAFVFLAGCMAKLNVAKTYTLEPEMADGFFLTAQPKPQKISIDFTADNDVTVLLFKAADAKDDHGATTADEKLALGFQTGKSGTLAVDVPEN